MFAVDLVIEVHLGVAERTRASGVDPPEVLEVCPMIGIAVGGQCRRQGDAGA